MQEDVCVSDIELWLERNPRVLQDIFMKKADASIVNRWLVRNGYCGLQESGHVTKQMSFSEDSSDPASPSPDTRTDVFFAKHTRNNSKKHLRHDYAKSKYRHMFRTYEPPVAVSDCTADDRRTNLKEMRMFRSLPPSSSNILSVLIQSKVRLPRYPSKDIDKKREQRHANEMEFFMDIVKDISNDLDLLSLSEKIIANINVLTDADHASIFVVEGKNNNKPSLVSKVFDVHSGTHFIPTKNVDNCIRVPWGKGIIGYVAEKGETVNLLEANKIINYKTGRRVHKLPPERHDIVRQATLGSDEAIVKAILTCDIQRQTTIEAIGDIIQEEIKNVASKTDPSVLRDTNVPSLKTFQWTAFEDELLKKAPTLSSILMSTQNTKQQKTKHLVPATLHIASSILSQSCRDLNAVKKIVAISLKRGGAKKRLFKTLSQLNMCVSYRTTARLLQSFGNEFDTKLLSWKQDVEEDVEKEKKLKKDICNVRTEEEKVSLTSELKNHQKCMHPGYQFVGDNVDFMVRVRHMSASHQNKDHHLFQCVAYKNRLPGYHLENKKPDNVSLTSLLPNVNDNQKLIDEFVHLTLKVWAEHIPALKFMDQHIQPYIPHPYMTQTRKPTEKVRLGVLPKNENKIDDMVDICQFLHQYVPGHSTETDNQPTKCLSGGDYLTYERHKKAQSTMQDSRTPSERLQGLQAKFEEFHTQAEVNKVIWTLLYNTGSTADIGTLHAARNSINARNVTKDPGDNFYAASSLLDKYTRALLVIGGLEAFSISTIESEIQFTGSEADNVEEVIETARKFVQTHCIPDTPDLPQVTEHKCADCHRTYQKKGNLARHRSTVHGIKPENENERTDTSQDFKYNYTRCAMPLLLLRYNHNDAIKYADGNRLERCHKFLIPYYRATGCTKYAYATLELIAQLQFLLSERQAFQLKWNRTANSRGLLDSNFPLDLDVEHENKVFKEHVTTHRGEITDNIIRMVSRSADVSESITKNLDKISCVRQDSGRHVDTSQMDDINVLVGQYVREDLFTVKIGRSHRAFPNISGNPFSETDPEKHKKWIKQSVREFQKKHYYL